MTFATLQDLLARYGEQEIRLLADRDNDGVIDANVVAAHLQDADGEIISELAGAVAIDATNPPLNLKRLACQIAKYRLYGSNPTEAARNDYKDAIAFLRLVRAGKASLDGGAGAAEAVAQPSFSAATEPGVRIFKRGL